MICETNVDNILNICPDPSENRIYAGNKIIFIFTKTNRPRNVNNFRKTYTAGQALQKLKHYCAYQERCHYEVMQKARQLGLRKTEAAEQVSGLIEEGYLNEERYARLFAGGKFRMKQWGRLKIRNELKQKKISDYCIKKGLQEIDDSEYEKAIRNLATKKWKQFNKQGDNLFVKMSGTKNYLLQKGYEPELIQRVINEMK